MTAMLLSLRQDAPHFTVRPGANGRWLVVHPLPGQPGAYGVDDDCPSQQAAECEAAHRERERIAQLQRVQCHSGNWH